MFIISNPYREHPLSFHRYHYPHEQKSPYTEASVTKQENRPYGPLYQKPDINASGETQRAGRG
jgi:hypothetical protein